MGKRTVCSALALVALLVLAAAATARIFGPEPVAVSSSGRRAANGPSGSPAISGDNRSARLIAFHSFASNLVPGDTNGKADVFIYTRATKRITRVSVGNSGQQANGASVDPAVDGSVQRGPRCVAFQSQATNLVPGDRNPNWSIYVRDLVARRTRLVSAGVPGASIDPAISGDCRQVAFTSQGRIYVGNGLRGGRAHFFAIGTNPSVSRDGSAITWERGHGVWLRRRGRTSRVAAIGGNPHVSDAGASQRWAVVYDGASDVFMKVFGPRGGAMKTLLISGRNGHSLGGSSHNGGVTAYGWPSGIVIFTNTQGSSTTLWYMNLHSGNIDDLAHGTSTNGNPAIFDVATSARANYAVFSSIDSYAGDSNGPMQDVFLKTLAGH